MKLWYEKHPQSTLPVFSAATSLRYSDNISTLRFRSPLTATQKPHSDSHFTHIYLSSLSEAVALQTRAGENPRSKNIFSTMQSQLVDRKRKRWSTIRTELKITGNSDTATLIASTVPVKVEPSIEAICKKFGVHDMRWSKNGASSSRILSGPETYPASRPRSSSKIRTRWW